MRVWLEIAASHPCEIKFKSSCVKGAFKKQSLKWRKPGSLLPSLTTLCGSRGKEESQEIAQ